MLSNHIAKYKWLSKHSYTQEKMSAKSVILTTGVKANSSVVTLSFGIS